MRRAALLVAMIALMGGPALADGGGPPAPRAPRAAAQPAPTGMQVAIDTAIALRLSAPARGVIVGNPSVVGVSVQSDRLLFVTGRTYGATSVTVVGEDGQTLYHGRVTVVPDETNAVVVTRGAETTRLICTPLCRPNPDVGDAPATFSRGIDQANTRASAARGAGGGN